MSGSGTWVELSSRQGNVELLEALVRARADVNQRRADDVRSASLQNLGDPLELGAQGKTTALQVAVRDSKPDVVRRLVTLKADIHAGEASASPMELAISGSSEAMIAALLVLAPHRAALVTHDFTAGR